MRIRWMMSAFCVMAFATSIPLFSQLEDVATAAADESAAAESIKFAEPVRLKADGVLIATESPGYAAPAWHDMDGDGLKDLLVGQFAGGKIKIYLNLGDGELAEGRWLEADGEVAQIPGVW